MEYANIPFAKVVFKNLEPSGLRKEDISFLCKMSLSKVGFGSVALYGAVKEKLMRHFVANDTVATKFELLPPRAHNGDNEPMAIHGQPRACHNWGGPDGALELQRLHHNYIQEGLNLEITEEDHCSEAQKNLSKALNHGG